MTNRADDLNLKQVATVLGVHYMTAYRYVRSLQLPARQVGNIWMVNSGDLESFQRRHLRSVSPTSSLDARTWRSRIRPALESGDEAEGWRIIERALGAGYPPLECYLEMLVGALSDISDASNNAPLASEYLAVSTASRLVARLGTRLRRPGRSRGTIIFGSPEGEYHSFPIAVVADLVRLSGFNCLELGPNVPPSVFANATLGVHRLVAVGIGLTMATSYPTLRKTVAAIRANDATIPIVLGGQAIVNPSDDSLIVDTIWAKDGRAAIPIFNELADQRRRLWANVGQY